MFRQEEMILNNGTAQSGICPNKRPASKKQGSLILCDRLVRIAGICASSFNRASKS
jgi:hypothetical protein